MSSSLSVNRNRGFDMKIAEQIKAIRIASSLTQAELAKKIGKSYGTMQKYEQGLIEPSFDVLNKICVACGVTIDTLLSYEPNSHITYLTDKFTQVVEKLYKSAEDIDISVQCESDCDYQVNRFRVYQMTLEHIDSMQADIDHALDASGISLHALEKKSDENT